jgi:D-sedoheptulose 7-phosphate isomerase
LPAFGLTSDTGALATQVGMLVSPHDMVMAFGDSRDANALSPAIAAARNRGCLTIANDALGAEVEFSSPTDNPFVWQELVETLYHVLWELVHVFLEHAASTSSGNETHPGASAFLYPFLTNDSRDLEAVVLDVARSVVIKANETTDLRERALATNGRLAAIAELIRSSNDRGGCVLAFGNGGSATDAVDFVADLLSPPARMNLSPIRALDLTDDSSIITALANDVGTDVVFARQIIAYGTSADVAVGFSTSGSSPNVIAAFAEARRRGIATVAFTGYDGGRIAAESLADHVLTVPSQYVPRIQEVHATAYHIIRSLVG